MGTMIVIFSKNGANIGTYMHMFSDAADEYTAFEFNFDTPAELTETPDSVIIGFIHMANDPEVSGALTRQDRIYRCRITAGTFKW